MGNHDYDDRLFPGRSVYGQILLRKVHPNARGDWLVFCLSRKRLPGSRSILVAADTFCYGSAGVAAADTIDLLQGVERERRQPPANDGSNWLNLARYVDWGPTLRLREALFVAMLRLYGFSRPPEPALELARSRWRSDRRPHLDPATGLPYRWWAAECAAAKSIMTVGDVRRSLLEIQGLIDSGFAPPIKWRWQIPATESKPPATGA
jgi:hypothetical protein